MKIQLLSRLNGMFLARRLNTNWVLLDMTHAVLNVGRIHPEGYPYFEKHTCEA